MIFEYLSVYLIVINAFSMLLMLADKQRAKKNLWRIPEATLLGFAVFGGSLGCLLGMQLFRHKTKKPKFSVGVPVILALQLMLVIGIYILL
ncbi:MAG: DUF1294 domain-containing protein [Oscillospiraceae bacterium]|nr:DUF1294 domain-containing protein [Oscillospiraceae bacterium]